MAQQFVCLTAYVPWVFWAIKLLALEGSGTAVTYRLKRRDLAPYQRDRSGEASGDDRKS